MKDAMKTLRVVCVNKFNVTDKQIEDLNNNYYIDNDDSDIKVNWACKLSRLMYKTLKSGFTFAQCYVHCIMENFGLMKKGKMNYNFSVKRVKTFIPVELQDIYIKAMDGCRDVGKAAFFIFG